MKEQKHQSEPRYMAVSEEVVFGLGGYFSRRLAMIDQKRSELRELQEEKKNARESLPKNKLLRAVRIISYGDWLTDYETDRIADLTRTHARLTEVMAEVISFGRVDRAEAELLKTLAGCFGYLKSSIRDSDGIGRRLAAATIETAEEAIEALAIIDPDAASEYREFLDGIRENEAFWRG